MTPDTITPPKPQMTDAHATPRVVLVTGPSGAGRSTAIRALEDLGFETIDNLPLGLIPRLMDGPPLSRPLALGVASSTRGVSADAVLDLVDGSIDGTETTLLYLDCAATVLQRRYSETRRRHPAAPADSPIEGLARERRILQPVLDRADILVDTSEMTLHDLRAEIDRIFGGAAEERLAVSVQSFSYKRGLPRGLDFVFDCRFLNNPYWVDSLRAKDGRDPDVTSYVTGDKRFHPFFETVRNLITLLLPAHVEEGKSHLSIGFGCTGGKHRSVCVTETLARTLAEDGWQVSIRHRELPESIPLAPGATTLSPASGDTR